RLPDPPAGLPVAFVSPVPLPSLEAHRSRRPGGLFTQLEKSHEEVLRHEEGRTVREAYLRLLEKEERRLLQLHGKLRAEARSAETAPDLRRRAEALLVHAQEIPRGADRFACPDPGDPTRTFEIDLDPTLSPPANADRIFRTARRLERGVPLRARRIRALEEAVARLSILKERARTGGTELERKGAGWLREALGRFARKREIERWDRRAADAAPAGGPAASRSAAREAPVRKRERGPAFHPRTYKTREGWTVLVGRSNAENDFVSHTLARPEDFWFHVHGCPGSHVVLRRQGRKDNPSVRTIEEVAAIAAWFSKARTSRKAPVVYTLKKYVRRPRKAPPGLALVTREKTVMVEPRAPEQGDPGGWTDESDED
ncbi:MAG: DUF814 domain-containing protein, partial [Candidatus Eisenbacteria bacterium]|nr:DUF814 domain-containing protein [Candidatus Latescibacterota bacterium]MBD3302974.1 DUF814 domain-containing protein [Candidatus Eisenbacteria bacterium]